MHLSRHYQLMESMCAEQLNDTAGFAHWLQYRLPGAPLPGGRRSSPSDDAVGPSLAQSGVGILGVDQCQATREIDDQCGDKDRHQGDDETGTTRRFSC